MCIKCDGFSERIPLSHRYEYFHIAEQIKEIIKEGTMEIVQGNCDFYSLEKGKLFPDDVIYHKFRCTSCNRKFELSVETYHGSGGEWDVEKIRGDKMEEILLSEFNEVHWDKFYKYYLSQYDKVEDEVIKSVLCLSIPDDIIVVLLIKLGEHLNKWIISSLPALGYIKPIDLLKSDKGLKVLKAAIMRMPD